MTWISGIDGYRDGWVVVKENMDASVISWCVVPKVIDHAFGDSMPQVIALDIPIGLPDKGPRACDQEARQLLGPGRMSSVFPAPIRPVLQASSHADASAVRKDVEGRGLPIQSWAIIPKIQEVDELIRTNMDLQMRVREVHPEVCFYFMAGRFPMKYSKKKRKGREERTSLLIAEFGDVVHDAMGDLRSLGCAPDDLLDAFAALWSARRIAKGIAITIPVKPRWDQYGIRMEIVA